MNIIYTTQELRNYSLIDTITNLPIKKCIKLTKEEMLQKNLAFGLNGSRFRYRISNCLCPGCIKHEIL
jgi:hypothetical protein